MAGRNVGAPVARAAGRAGGLDRECIVEHAIALIDDEGLDRFTMRRLAARLDVVAGTLYLYFRDREELLDAVRETVVATLDNGLEWEEGDWQEAARRMMHRIRSHLLERPSMIPLLQTSRKVLPAMTQQGRLFTAILRSAGFAGEELVRNQRVLIWATYGFIAMEQQLRSSPAALHRPGPDGGTVRGGSLEMRHPHRYLIEVAEEGSGVDPEDAALLPYVRTIDVDDLFEAMVDTVLAGVAASARR